MSVTVGTVVAVAVGVAVVAVLVGVKVYFTYTSGHCRSTRSMLGKTVIVTGSTAGVCLRRKGRALVQTRHTETERLIKIFTFLEVSERKRHVISCGVGPGSSSPAGIWKRALGWLVSFRGKQERVELRKGVCTK